MEKGILSHNLQTSAMAEAQEGGATAPPGYISTVFRDPPAAYMDKVQAGIEAAARKWYIDLDPVVDYTTYVFARGPNSTRFGNRPIEPTTKDNYEGCLRQLWRFCALKGD